MPTTRDCPNCGWSMHINGGFFECQNCGKILDAAGALAASERSGSGGGYGAPGYAPATPGRGAATGISSDPLAGEKRIFFGIQIAWAALAILGVFIANMMISRAIETSGGTGGLSAALLPGVLIGAGFNLWLTWWLLNTQLSCWKWGCGVMNALGALGNLVQLFLLRDAYVQMTQIPPEVARIIYMPMVLAGLIGIGMTTWFASILIRDAIRLSRR